MRICSECKEKMIEGYCIDDGLEYYCSDECLHKHYTKEEYLEMYDEGNGGSYWTEWEEEEEMIRDGYIKALEFKIRDLDHEIKE